MRTNPAPERSQATGLVGIVERVRRGAWWLGAALFGVVLVVVAGAGLALAAGLGTPVGSAGSAVVFVRAGGVSVQVAEGVLVFAALLGAAAVGTVLFVAAAVIDA